MSEQKVKILKFRPERCNGCLDCERACAKFQSKGSAIQILKNEKGFSMHVCNQRGLCMDLCTVGALKRRKDGVVILNEKKCVGCLVCVAFCPISAMRVKDTQPFKCISCGSCVRACPENALHLAEVNIEEVKEVVYHRLGV
jgi:Fe-S-cluster-containing hydrogenase component 2